MAVPVAAGMAVAVRSQVQNRAIRRWSVLSSSASSPLRTVRHAELAPVLLSNLLVHPLFELGFGLVNRHLAAHLVMAPAAKLGADQLKFAGRVGVEPDRNRQARNGVLLDSQVRQIERMDHVRRFQINERLFVLDEMQVIDGEQVVAGIQLAVGAGIADHPLELPGGDLGQRRARGARRCGT